MEHLKREALARLVDESPEAGEEAHLSTCVVCSAELEAIRGQTEALASLPEILPPMDDWKVLEARLRSEGLFQDPGLFRRFGLAQTPPWMKAAAAVLLFLAGTGTGATLAQASSTEASTGPITAATSVESAASALRVAEQDYVTAVAQYQELLARDSGDRPGADPISRFAALEHLVMVSQAAVRQAPGDPFLNGFLASAMAERDVAFRQVSVKRDNWF